MSNNAKNSNPPVSVLGLPLSRVTLDGAVEQIDQMLQDGGVHQVATANLDFWLNSTSDEHLHRILAGCDMVVADGMPLVWASRMLGEPLPERVTGVDLIPRLMQLSARKGYKVFLLGGAEGIGERAKELFERWYPGVQICGVYAPPAAELNQMDHGEIVARVAAAKPDMLLVSFGNPKQEKWIWMHKKRLGVPVSIGIGGSLDMLLGDLNRAPRWMQRIGMEWLMRLAQEPRRLGPRYLRDFIGLTSRLPIALAASMMQGQKITKPSVLLMESPEALHLHIDGDLDASLSEVIASTSERAVAEGRMLYLQMEKVQRITAAGAGLMLDCRRKLFNAGLVVCTTGLSLRLKLLMYHWCLSPLFNEYSPYRNYVKAGGAKPVLSVTNKA
uniref:Putative N-acetylglucosaminyldiphosphoundecaprenol N-acetyl-beta-D-mannosaminyltransferase (Modular protein) n=1 Tax=mine drainage metagenome TaxID=410659 RepID=E6QMG4_9ZZZZ